MCEGKNEIISGLCSTKVRILDQPISAGLKNSVRPPILFSLNDNPCVHSLLLGIPRQSGCQGDYRDLLDTFTTWENLLDEVKGICEGAEKRHFLKKIQMYTGINRKPGIQSCKG